MRILKWLPLSLLMLGATGCDEKAASSSPAARTPPDAAQFQAVQRIQQLQEQLLINPNDFEALSLLGDLYFESGQYALAIQSYDKATAINPQCADCLNDKGLAQFYTGDAQGALVSLDQATAIDPSYPNAWLSKGYVLYSTGRFREAIEPLRQVSAVDSSETLTAEADKFLAKIEEQLSQE